MFSRGLAVNRVLVRQLLAPLLANDTRVREIIDTWTQTMKTARRRSVCAVVVNWNGWQDTVACVRSLLDVQGPPLWIVVCDNGSTDGSNEQLKGWLSHELGVAGMKNGDAGLRMQATAFDRKPDTQTDKVVSVHLLELAANFGYAAALNRGILWGQRQFAARSFWLLNNDVQAEPTALRCLIAAKDAVPGAGLCGSVLLEWGRPAEIQAIGGVFRKPLGVAWHRRKLPQGAQPFPDVCLDVDYPIGASLFVEQDYLEKVGLMEESYFLYCEEMDWVERGRRHGYRPVVAMESRLFHKEGASTQSHGGVRKLSLLSERYGAINRLRITVKFWPIYLPVVWLSLWLVVCDRLIHAEWARARLVLRVMFSPRLWAGARREPSQTVCG
jgi:GT2 family glycosyltransferase